MSGEDEKTAVPSSPTPEANSNDTEAKMEEENEPVTNGEEVPEGAKKPAKRKAASSKKTKDESDEEDEGEAPRNTQNKKKGAQLKKSPVKKPKKEESGDEEEDEEEEEEEESAKKPASPRKGTKAAPKDEVTKVAEKGVPLLDQPLEIEGSRARKTVSRFSFINTEEDKKPFAIPDGKGTKLGDIARIEHYISILKPENVKLVSKALFGARGPLKIQMKRSIRDFNGYDFDKNSEQWEKRKTLLSKTKLKDLKVICETLDLERSGTVVAHVERIMNFCIKPTDSGKKPPQSKKKSKSGSKTSKSKQSKGSGGSKKKQASKKKEESSDESGEDEEKEEKVTKQHSKGNKAKKQKEESSADEKEDGSDRESEEDEKKEEDDAKSDVSEDDVKNKKEKGKAKKAAKPATKKATKKAPPKKAPTKKKAIESSEEEDKASSSEDDEPLVKIAKPSSPPSDEDIKTFVKKILEGANLEEITMKTVCQQVYENYPEHDLAHKKDLIKKTVKSVIST